MIVLRGCAFPDDRYYHVDYNVWVQQSAHDVVTIGATAYGAALAIEFFAFMPKPLASEIEAGRAVGLLELSKTVVSVRSPVAGIIMEINREAVAKPEIVSTDPYGSGWLVRLASSVPIAETAGLLTGDAVIAPFQAAMTMENFEGRRV